MAVRKPILYSLLLALALCLVAIVALVLRAKAPPEVARLLPECDAIVYANLKPLRSATHFDRTPVARSPEFQQFIDATGIVPERDLDTAAFALHRTSNPAGPNGPVAYSEVFEGRFDGGRLAQYLSRLATAKETYAGHDIFTIPVGEATAPGAARRNLRVTQLGRDTIAASNTPSAEQIHAMLDRSRATITLFSGPSLLSGLYAEVPLLSSAWAIGQVGLPLSENGYVTLFGLRLPLPEETTFIASLRYTGSIKLRVEEIAPSAGDAAQTAQALSSMLSLLRSVELNQSGGTQDASMRKMLTSLSVRPDKERVVLSGSIPVDLLRHLSTPADQAPPTTPSASH